MLINLIVYTYITFFSPPLGRLINDPVLVKELDLSKTQMKQIENLYFSTQKDLLNIRSQRSLLQLELNEELSNDSPQLDKIDNLLKQISELNLKESKLRIRRYLKMREILTDEQMLKLKLMLKQLPRGKPHMTHFPRHGMHMWR